MFRRKQKNITFSVPTNKELHNGKSSIKYKIKFIDSFRFMSKPLPNLARYLSDIYIYQTL